MQNFYFFFILCLKNALFAPCISIKKIEWLSVFSFDIRVAYTNGR